VGKQERKGKAALKLMCKNVFLGWKIFHIIRNNIKEKPTPTK